MLAVVALVSFGESVGAQFDGGLVFTNYGMEDGLSQGAVEAIVQDAAGFLWIGTHGGVDRFDGIGFRAYRSRRDDPASLSDDYVLALAVAEDGRLWVGTEAGGLNLLDPLTGNASRYLLGDLGPWSTDVRDRVDGRSGRTVREIAVFGDGSLVLLTDAGLAWFEPGTGEYGLRAPARPSPASALCALRDGRVVVGFGDGSLETLTRARPSPSIPGGRGLPTLSVGVAALGCASDGEQLLVAGNDGSISELRFDEPLVRDIGRLPRASGGRRRVVSDLLRLPDGAVWAATNEGVWRFPSGGAVPELASAATPDRSIPHEQALSLLVDARGTLWIGTWNGLASLHPLHATFRRLFAGTGGLHTGGVISIEADASGRVWVGTDGGGVQTLVGDWRSPGLRAESPRVPGQESRSVVFGLALDPGGALWIAGFTDGLMRREPDGRTVSVPAVGTSGELVTPVGYSVFVDSRGVVWAGSYAQGLLRFEDRSGVFVSHMTPGERRRFGSDFIWPIAEDHEGRLWVGAFNGGLAVLDRERTSVELYTAGPGGLSDSRVLCVFVDSRGTVWAGTEGGGLNRFDGEGGFAVFTTDEGLPHDNVEAVLEDALGYLWVSTADGLARFDPVSEEFLVFTDVAGLAGNRFWANSAHRGARGEMFFGGPAGITVFDPADIRRREAPPPAALTAFRIQGRDAPLARAQAPGGLDLAPSENFFAFEFAALDFVDASQNRYRYRLDGLDEDWVDAGSSPVANYTSVPPARYVFKVAARNSEGSWNEDAIAIPLRVRAPFHQTPWFRAGVIAVVLSLLSGAYVYRVRQIEARQQLRLSIAGRLHDDIGVDLSTIALKASIVVKAEALDHGARRHLEEVGMLARSSAHKVRETVWVVNTRYDTVAGLVSKLRDTVDTVLAGQSSYTLEEPRDLPEARVGMETRQNIYLMFKEALHNVVKHAPGASVRIVLGVDARELWFRVQDDGPGFERTGHESGNGLALMRHRAELCRGTASVTSRAGGPTVVEVHARLR